MKSPLVSGEELKALSTQVRILDARPGAPLYAAGHLKGAIHADLDEALSSVRSAGHDPANGGRHPLPSCEAFARTLDSWGVTEDTDVVIYDDQGGANAATRAWWMLRAFGVERVRLIDGGWKAAVASGMELATEVPLVASTSTRWPTHWERPTIPMQDIEGLVSTPGWKLLDVRSAERFRGEKEHLDPVAGHIPGAMNLFFGENLDASGRWKSPDELQAMYAPILDASPPSQLIVHCGSGVTACHTLFALEVAGLVGSPLYVGGWSEWCRSGKPQAKGG